MRGNKPFSPNFLNNRLAANNGGTIANAAVLKPSTLLLLILTAASWCLWRGRKA